MVASPFDSVRWIWVNGEMVPFADAKVHLLTHALHYGSAWFEGIRCYETVSGSAVFRLQDHMARLETSCKLYRADLPYGVDALCQATVETIQANELAACYIRPIIWRGFGSVGVNPLPCPVEAAIAVWPWGSYLGEGAADAGVDVCVSSWRRTNSESLPSIAKAAGGYLNCQLVKMEALLAGFAEGIALDSDGYVSEGSSENLFLVQDGVLWTPPLSCSILPGITRDTVLKIAQEDGIPVREQHISRGSLYACDELFLTGTAAEITPVRSVDRISVRAQGPGPVTRHLQGRFNAIIRGETPDRHGWLTPVPAMVPVGVAG